jgi:hypothetical protein
MRSDGSPNGIKKSLSYLLTEDEKEEIVEGVYRLRVIKYASHTVPFPTIPLYIPDGRFILAYGAHWCQL